MSRAPASKSVSLPAETFSVSLLLNTDLVLVELDEIFLASNDDVVVASFAEIVAAAALTAFAGELATDKLLGRFDKDVVVKWPHIVIKLRYIFKCVLLDVSCPAALCN